MRIVCDLFKKRYYYSLFDLLTKLNVSTKLFGVETMKNIIDNHFTNYIATTGMFYYEGINANAIWQMIYAKYKNEFVIVSDKKPEELTDKDIFKGFEDIFTRMQETYPKWDLLLTKYANTNDLFAPLKSKTSFGSTNRFNDTPQIASGYEGDSYASNFTKINSDTITENDSNTIMARIMEVDMNYKNLIEDWAKSFFDIFIEELNIQGEEVDL